MVNLLTSNFLQYQIHFQNFYLHYYVNETIFTTKFDDIFFNIFNRILNVQVMSDVKTEDVFRVIFLVKYLFLFVIKNIELLKPPFFTSYLIVLFCNVLILMTIYPLSFKKKNRWIHIRFTYSPKKIPRI